MKKPVTKKTKVNIAAICMPFVTISLFIASEFVKNKTLSSLLLVAYLMSILAYTYLLRGDRRDSQLGYDRVMWTLDNSIRSMLIVRYLVPITPRDRFTRMMRKIDGKTTLCLFERWYSTRTNPYLPEDGTPQRSHTSFTVTSKQFFDLKLRGIIETQDTEKAERALAELGVIPEGYFREKD